VSRCGGAEEDTGVVRRRSAARGGGLQWARTGAVARVTVRWGVGGLPRPRSGAGGHAVGWWRALVAAL
jgi:hypothetical protein